MKNISVALFFATFFSLFSLFTAQKVIQRNSSTSLVPSTTYQVQPALVSVTTHQVTQPNTSVLTRLGQQFPLYNTLDNNMRLWIADLTFTFIELSHTNVVDHFYDEQTIFVNAVYNAIRDIYELPEYDFDRNDPVLAELQEQVVDENFRLQSAIATRSRDIEMRLLVGNILLVLFFISIPFSIWYKATHMGWF